jgi:hypothetical protein
VAQSGGSSRFLDDSCAIGGVDTRNALDDLDRDRALQFLVVRTLDDAHSSRAKSGQDAELAERFADHLKGTR